MYRIDYKGTVQKPTISSGVSANAGGYYGVIVSSANIENGGVLSVGGGAVAVSPLINTVPSLKIIMATITRWVIQPV